MTEPTGRITTATEGGRRLPAWLAGGVVDLSVPTPPGGNAEDCRFCTDQNLPYPFVCPGHTAEEQQAAPVPDAGLRERYAVAIRDAVRVHLGTNAMDMAQRGVPVPLNYSEADAAADAALAVRERRMEEMERGWQRAEQATADVLRIVTDWVVEANDIGGIDADDLVFRLEQAGHPLPDEVA
ncbi:hypothetical protein [Streptomyces sp. H27-D2]|uniref:hypothetical protein n=1 Tax=Streptomyces sp. H27-D2 TaxID=3046304 RepID=UPI002DBBF482|nr:hypothetical protein [Streptomyces sp. H27-D2]MEC4016061.1 hypothetical protein [Streptomyces sp. H27-D2]